MTANTGAWLARVRDDLRSAEIDPTASPPLLGDAAFHCQQAVGKALEAFLAWHDRPFRKRHALVELGAECVAIAPALEPRLRGKAPLTVSRASEGVLTMKQMCRHLCGHVGRSRGRLP